MDRPIDPEIVKSMIGGYVLAIAQLQTENEALKKQLAAPKAPEG